MICSLEFESAGESLHEPRLVSQAIMENFVKYGLPVVGTVSVVFLVAVGMWAYRRVNSVAQTLHERSTALIRSAGTTKAKKGTAAAEIAEQTSLMREYHDQGLDQCRISFLFSVAFALMGFAVIVGALIAIFAQETQRSNDLVDELARQSADLDRQLEQYGTEDAALVVEARTISREKPQRMLEHEQADREVRMKDEESTDAMSDLAELSSNIDAAAELCDQRFVEREELRLRREAEFDRLQQGMIETGEPEVQAGDVEAEQLRLVKAHQLELQTSFRAIRATLLHSSPLATQEAVTAVAPEQAKPETKRDSVRLNRTAATDSSQPRRQPDVVLLRGPMRQRAIAPVRISGPRWQETCLHHHKSLHLRFAWH